MYIYIYIYINLKPQKCSKCVYCVKGKLKTHFSYKYFNVFTKSSTVYMDQIFGKKIYSQQ